MMTILSVVPKAYQILLNHNAQKFRYNFGLKVKRILIVAK